ncbi:hypothetical protein CN918_25360 [Priestia megaterium]|nr:hypothetical protein CN918_25360 [Priestia megaterium]
MYGSVKSKKILKNEKHLKKLHGIIILSCSNENCPNSIKVTNDESKRAFLCTKCMKGYLKK